jgi:1-deoxy-D-xylulose-5-phosphate synthase
LIHDVALQKLPMVLALDRAGIVGADGATHAGLFDIPFLRCIPHVSIACPADENECRQLLSTAYAQDHCVAVRYPRGAGAGVPVQAGLEGLPFGKGELRRQGQGIAVLVFGTLLYPALKAAESLNLTVVNMRWAKPLDVDLLADVAASHEALVTLEEGALMGGAGDAVLEALQTLGLIKPVLSLGVGDQLTEHGDPVHLLAELGLDAPGIAASISQRFPKLLSSV